MSEGPRFDGAMLMPRMVTVTTASAGPRGSAPVDGNATFLEPSSCRDFDEGRAATRDGRNRCVTELMTLIDGAFQRYQTAVSYRIGAANFSLDAVATVGSAASTATGGTAAKVLSAIASVASGSKTALGEDLLYKATVQVLLTTMKGNRDRDAAAIKLSMQQDLGVYPMEVARNDLLKYLNDGTLVEAFASVNQNASATAQACQNANQAVTSAAKSGSLGAQAAKDASARSAAAATPQTQCDQIVSAISFRWDASASAADLMSLLGGAGGVVDPKAVAAVRGCVASVTPPKGFDASRYANPDGSVDVAQLAADGAVDGAFKAALLSCARTAIRAGAAS